MPRKGDITPILVARPELAEQWDYERNTVHPATVGKGSKVPVWWKCEKGPDHRWEVPPRARFTRKAGCPFCAGVRVSVTNSLEGLFPAIAAELDVERTGKTAGEFTSMSSQRVWWKCSVGHSWSTLVANRTRLGHGCAQCSGRAAVPGRNTLAAEHPDLLAQWDYSRNTVDPDHIRSGHRTPVWWRCPVEDDHRWDAPPANRTKQGQGCPMCAGQRVVRSNSFAKAHPELVDQMVLERSADPFTVTPRTNMKAWWRCPVENHPDYESSFGDRSAGQGCPYCAGKRVVPGESLADIYPDLAGEWHPKNRATPYEYRPGSSKRVWWRCTVDAAHEWRAAVKTRTSVRAGCPECVRVRRTSVAETRLRMLLGTVAPMSEERSFKIGGRRRTVDIRLADAPIIVEYDGSYYHRTEAHHTRDTKKAELLAADGYTVIRVREAPLGQITEHDVLIGANQDIVYTANEVLARIDELHPGLLARTTVDVDSARAAVAEADRQVAQMRADYAARKAARAA